MNGIRNFRSPAGAAVIGGAVGGGRLYRSGHLADATDADLRQLGELGIRTVIDLRTDHDIDAEGSDRVPPGAVHHRHPIEDDAGQGSKIRELITAGDMGAIRDAFGGGRSMEIATQAAVDFVTSPQLAALFADVVEIVFDADAWPVLWHCSAGKDRAGWVGTTVLLALGADDQTIVDHYLESNAGAGPLPDEEPWPMLRPFMRVQEEFVRAQLAAMRARWATPEEMLHQQLGVSASTLERFRASALA